MPLTTGDTYTADEITPYVADDDIANIQEWFPMESLTFTYHPMPLVYFQSQIDDMEASYGECVRDRERTENIEDVLRQGSEPLPVFVEDGDETHFVLEGRHRIVAFARVDMKSVPVIFVHRKRS